MNKKQKIVLWIGIAVIVIMGIFPPWVISGYSTGRPIAGSYSLITSPPKMGEAYAKSIDLYRLGVQWVIVGVITGGLIYTFKDQKDKKTKHEQNQ